MFDQLDDYVRRPRYYQHIDGIWEMGIGFMLVMMVLLENSWRGAPPNTLWRWRGTFVLSMALLLFVVLCGVKALKERVTYRRTGFVKYRGLAGKPWLVGLITGATAVPVTLLVCLLLRHIKLSVTAAVTSVMWGFLYALHTKLDEAWRWVVLVVIVLGPVAIFMLPLDRALLEEGLPLEFMGLTWFVSGVIAFCLYLRRTRPAKQEAQ